MLTNNVGSGAPVVRHLAVVTTGADVVSAANHEPTQSGCPMLGDADRDGRPAEPVTMTSSGSMLRHDGTDSILKLQTL